MALILVSWAAFPPRQPAIPSELARTNQTGTDPIRLTEGTSIDLVPKWSPDSRQISYRSQNGDDVQIRIVPVEGGAYRVLDVGMSGADLHTSWSPDGAEIAFDEGTIWLVRASGGEPRRIYDGAGGAAHPCWSPTGGRLAFASHRSGSMDIWILTVADGTLLRLTSGEGSNFHPSWSPDGSRVAFASDRAGSWDIWTIPSLGGEAMQVTASDFRDDVPSWSPDSRLIVFMRGETERNLMVVSASGGTVEALTEGPEDDGYPAWSPDGRWIAFHSNRSGSYDIWLLRTESLNGIVERIGGHFDKEP